MENKDLRYGHPPIRGNVLAESLELTEYQSSFSDQSATVLSGHIAEHVVPESFDENGKFQPETFIEKLVSFFQRCVVTSTVKKNDDFLAFSIVDWAGPEEVVVTDAVIDEFMTGGMKRIVDVWNADQEQKERKIAAHNVLQDNLYDIRHLKPEEYSHALDLLKKNVESALAGEDYDKSIFYEQGIKRRKYLKSYATKSAYDDNQKDDEEFKAALNGGIDSFVSWLANNINSKYDYDSQAEFEKDMSIMSPIQHGENDWHHNLASEVELISADLLKSSIENITKQRNKVRLTTHKQEKNNEAK